MAINEGKLNALLGTMVTELGAALTGACVILGDQLGLYRRAGRRQWADIDAIGRTHRHGGTLCARMAGGTGSVWVHRL